MLCILKTYNGAITGVSGKKENRYYYTKCYRPGVLFIVWLPLFRLSIHDYLVIIPVISFADTNIHKVYPTAFDVHTRAKIV